MSTITCKVSGSKNIRTPSCEEFRSLPTRAAAHVGGVYQADPVELVRQLDGFFTAAQGPGLPDARMLASTPKAIVAPHIDFHRGGPAYAWAYKSLAESAGADLYILLGTSHCSGRSPYILTLKDFETPLGLVETDREFVQKLQAVAPKIALPMNICTAASTRSSFRSSY